MEVVCVCDTDHNAIYRLKEHVHIKTTSNEIMCKWKLCVCVTLTIMQSIG